MISKPKEINISEALFANDLIARDHYLCQRSAELFCYADGEHFRLYWPLGLLVVLL